MQYDRIQLASINNIQLRRLNENKACPDRSTTVPEKETFKQIFEKAKKGNEMAAVLLYEWQKNCIPKDDKEKQVIILINKAAEDLFK